MDFKKLLEILDRHVDQNALAKDLLKEAVLPKLDELVAKSPTKIDDAALAVAKQVLKQLLGD